MKKFPWRAALGFALSAALLIWVLRDVKPHEVWEVLRRSNPWLFFAAIVAGTAIFPLRARRWRAILDPIVPNLPLGPLWRSTAIGMMVNNVVPARAGEFARAYALTREVPAVPFAASFASLAVDRLFDVLVVFGLMFLSMLDPAFPEDARIGTQPVANWAGGGVFVIAVLLGALYAVAVFPARLITWYSAFAKRTIPRFETRGRDLLQAFAAGLSVLRSPRRFAEVLFWTTLHWLLNAFAFWLAFRAVGITTPFSGALFLQAVIAIGVAVPSSPGFFGVFEKGAQLGLALYGVPATLAVSWAIGFHILSFIPITVIGAFYAARLGLRLREIKTSASASTGLDAPVAAPSEGA